MKKSIKRIIVLFLCTAMLFSVIACAADPDDSGTQTPQQPAPQAPDSGTDTGTGGTEPDTPQANLSKAPEDMTAEDWETLRLEHRTLNLNLFKALFSDELWDWILADFQELHPNWTIIDERFDVFEATVLQAELLMGTPRTFSVSNWEFTGHRQLAEGVLLPVDPILNSPAFDDPGLTVRDTIHPGTPMTIMNGENYSVPYRFSADGFWYNVDMFEEHGWEEPQTWNEFLELSNKIQEAGIVPLMFTATFAPYPFTMLMYPRGAVLGGYDWAIALRNLDYDAWNSATTRRMVEDFVSLREHGVFNDDVLGTDYLMAQQLFFEGQAAMVLSGTWLEVEMMEVIPEGFRFAFMPAPVKQNRSDPAFVVSSPMGWGLYRNSGQELEGMQFIRYAVSERVLTKYAEIDGHSTLFSTQVDLSRADLSPAAWTIYHTMNRPDIVSIPNDLISLASGPYFDFCNGVVGILAGNETLDNLIPTAANAMREARNDPDFVFVEQE